MSRFSTKTNSVSETHVGSVYAGFSYSTVDDPDLRSRTLMA